MQTYIYLYMKIYSILLYYSRFFFSPKLNANRRIYLCESRVMSMHVLVIGSYLFHPSFGDVRERFHWIRIFGPHVRDLSGSDRLYNYHNDRYTIFVISYKA